MNSVDEQIELLKARRAGLTLEYKKDGIWQCSIKPNFMLYTYRIKHCEMELIHNLKLVNYLGSDFTIPESANYMAIDKDGVLYAYEEKPNIDLETFFEWVNSKGDYFEIATVSFVSDWSSSLRLTC